jgi:hypothetical protein
VWGQYESTGTNNVQTCVNETALPGDAPQTALPSHPPLPTIPVQIPSDGDAVGNNFVAKWENINFEPRISTMFPDIGVYQSCQAYPIAPAVALQIASFLTETSTSYTSSHPTSKANNPAGGGAQPVSQPTIPLPQSTANLLAGPGQTPGDGGTPTTPVVLTVGGQTITANPGGVVAVGGQTVAPGGPAITVSGTPISVAPGATAVVVGSNTVPIIGNGGMPRVLTVGGQTITANPAGQLTIGGQTLVPGGPAITVSGTRLSLAPGATDIVVGTSTVAITGGYTGPMANGAAGMDCAWRGLLMAACWAVWYGFSWLAS